LAASIVGSSRKVKDRWEFDREMRGEALRDTTTARSIDEVIDPVLEMTASDGDTAR
jgi:hypothetical protein